MSHRRFWFQIKATNQIQSIWAVSFTEAKAKAALMYLPQWQGIEWLDLDGKGSATPAAAYINHTHTR